MKIYYLVAVFLFANILNAQNKYNLNVGEIKEKKYHSTFDFEDINGKIIIDVKINNKIRKFFLDTGAPTMISNEIASAKNYKKVFKSAVTDANSTTENLEVIQLPEFSVNDITFINNYALKIKDMTIFDCFNVEGIIGSNSLRNSVIDFDFKAKKITITSNFESLGYGPIKENKLLFKDLQSTPILEIKMKLGYFRYSEEVIFDTGDNSFYSISTSNLNKITTLIKENQIPKELQNINQSDLLGIIGSSNGSFTWSLFGNEKNNIQYKFKIQEFDFSGTLFNNIIATTNYGGNSNIGSEILKYGKLTLDYKKEKYYFQVYENQKEINVNHKFKSIYPIVENDKLIVGIVWDSKITDKVNIGDEIMSINNIDLSLLTKCQILKMSFENFKEENKLIMKIKDKATNEIKVVTIQN